MHRLFYWSLLWLLSYTFTASAQNNELPYSTLTLTNLADFKPAGTNWHIAGDVYYDPIKGGKSSTKTGTGVVVNESSGKGKEPLFTKLEHGDIELMLDFMVDKGTNSGLFLEGRYEVQLTDSWGVKEPGANQCGAIAERWDDSRPDGRRGYEGHLPTQNVSRAPGLWQHLMVVFRAPRFDEKGQKIANAHFMRVVQNGVTLHENVELTGPTRGAAFQDEKPTGPLMIQGDNGSIAIRDIHYKAYEIESVALTNLKLSTFDGKFKAVTDFNSLTPKRVMDIDVLAHQAPGSRDNFGGEIVGTIHLPRSGQYLFNLNLTWIPAETNPANPNGAGELRIGDKSILAISGKNGGTATATVNLNAGDYPIVLAYYKNFGLWYARTNDILLSVEGPGVQYTTLNPVIRAQDPVGEISVLTKDEPVMQRGFVNHHGVKHTHTISVGEPGQANYSLDLSKGELLQIWRGDFLETTPMWYGRGETQLAVPLGSVIELAGKPSLALLADKNAAWPDSNATYNNRGYDVDKAGRPIFKYTLGNVGVRESFAAEDNGRKLSHSFTITPGQETGDIWCRVAEGSDISELPNGLYAVNNKQYFIQLADKEKPLIRSTTKNTKELLLPIKTTGNTGTIAYSIIW